MSSRAPRTEQRPIEGALVLVVTEDEKLEDLLSTALVSAGHRVVLASSGADAVREATSQTPDAIVLDLEVPGSHGLELLSRLCECARGPVVVASGSIDESDEVAALETGADDYLTLPVAAPEFLERVRLSLQRVAARAGTAHAAPFCTGDLVVDLQARKVTVRERLVRLTPTEYKILATLVVHAGTVVSGKDLLAQVWGAKHVEQTHYLRVYVDHLRRKLELSVSAPRYILSEPGLGYRLGLGA